MLVASNKSLADYNLSRHEEFQEKKYKLIDLYQELKEINSIVEEKSAKLSEFRCRRCVGRFEMIILRRMLHFFTFSEELTSKSNTEVVLTLLQTATSEIEQETDVRIICIFKNDDVRLILDAFMIITYIAGHSGKIFE